MSKKKAVTTMTLKDFHGGSIPSELPLPSAPGVTPRPADRTVASASPVAAAVARPRVPVASPAAAAAAAAMPSFLTNPSRIGRHFDEDERTPFEPTTPRRPAPSPTSFAPAPVVAPTRSGPGNAWGPKKEASSAPSPVGHAPASAGDQIWSATRIAQASAVEKVISGRWHPPKPTSPPAPVSVPVLETPVAPPEIERPRSVGVRELDSGVERGAAPVRPASHEGRIGEGRAGEVPERPKLKLLPRSKPIEDPEQRPTYVEAKQVHQVQVTAGLMKAEDNHDLHQNARATETGVLGADAESRVAERPRLNLKPRSYVTGQSDEIAVKERPSLFGGARPREQVLKERGVDVLASDLEKTSPVGRPKGEFAKVEQKVEAMSINPSVERHESFAAGHRGPRNGDKKDHKWNTDRADAYRLTRREDNRRVARDMEKPQEQPRPEPETWRKPVEPPKLEVATPRFGKAATALELAQAFSTSMSDTAPQSRLTSAPSPRVPPSPGASRDQSGFSRLTDSRTLHSGPSQRKINGY
ncbi:hypothetical protein Zm00014a_015486 [Zea mays]|uniref:HAT dimerization domain-containing protein n=3 Tax=Zea mays TaxID=4577 RepID=C0PF30_MAIZE|nr:uncharacterized protein LOC100383319 [Zea mays]ACN33796.1 unknown [Zea mays]ONM24230.1 hAT dimerization domain-containing protein [Zea mays]PWZ36739.1 hypothetical protein Zm00014a_015486 [Zea mays]|eukprot:NP_001169448.1 uncharacterized protein LOC100383319 [Zea mays]